TPERSSSSHRALAIDSMPGSISFISFLRSQTSHHPMAQGRQGLTHALEALGTELAGHDPFVLGQASQHLAPGIDQHGMPPGSAAILMLAALGAGEHVALVLDRPRPQQN